MPNAPQQRKPILLQKVPYEANRRWQEDLQGQNEVSGEADGLPGVERTPMTAKITKADREKALGIRLNLSYKDPNRATSIIAQALADQREEDIKTLEEADPLESICNWENSDDIAFAVQKFLVSKIRKGHP